MASIPVGRRTARCAASALVAGPTGWARPARDCGDTAQYGNSTDPEQWGWHAANGTGIWISPGSDRNDVVDNRITDGAMHHVVLEGNENVVAGVESAGVVLDLGRRTA